MLEALLREMEPQIRSLGSEIQSLRAGAVQKRMQSQNYYEMAQELMSRTYDPEDEDSASRAAEAYSQAQSYMEEASRCEAMANEMEMQAFDRADQLRQYRYQYEDFMAEGQNNLADLQITAQKLMALTNSTYGAAKIKDALELTQKRILYNQNLVKGCQARINWIDQLCGPGGDQYRKVLRR